VISLSGRDLLSVDISDRDNPVVKADLALSVDGGSGFWSKAIFLIENREWRKLVLQLRANRHCGFCEAANSDRVMNTITLSNGWPIVGADLRGKLSLCRSKTPSIAQKLVVYFRWR